jgi:DNA-binding NarL/FixJ family response regulator
LTHLAAIPRFVLENVTGPRKAWPVDEEVRMNPKQRPTRRQLEVLRMYIRAGSVAAAACELGISETTARQHLSGLYGRTGCLNAAQAAYWLGRADIRRSSVADATLYWPPHPAMPMAHSDL